MSHQDQLDAYNKAIVKIQDLPQDTTELTFSMNRKVGEGFNAGSEKKLSSDDVTVYLDDKRNIITIFPNVKEKGY